MRCLLLVLVLFVQACCADKVHVRLTVTGPTGPIADVQFVAHGRCAERGVPSPVVFATTDANGVAELDITRCSDPWIKLYAVPRDPDPNNPGTRTGYLEEKRINDLGLNYVKWVKLGQNQSLLEIEFSAPGGVTVTLRPQGTFRKDVQHEWISPDGMSSLALPDKSTGVVRLEGARKGMTGRYYIGFPQLTVRNQVTTKVERFVPIVLQNLEQDVDLGVVEVPNPPSAATLDITQTMRPVIPELEPYYNTSTVTLISADALT
jgi:hypothetical protein